MVLTGSKGSAGGERALPPGAERAHVPHDGGGPGPHAAFWKGAFSPSERCNYSIVQLSDSSGASRKVGATTALIPPETFPMATVVFSLPAGGL